MRCMTNEEFNFVDNLFYNPAFIRDVSMVNRNNVHDLCSVRDYYGLNREQLLYALKRIPSDQTEMF